MNRPEINVTPLIDVLLVLLIIFMIVSPIRPSSLEAKVPDEPSDDRRLQPSELSLVVTVEDDGELRVNTERLGASIEEPAALTERLRKIIAEREANGVMASLPPSVSGKAVFIKGRSRLNYGSVARIVDAVKLSGAGPIGLQIDALPN